MKRRIAELVLWTIALSAMVVAAIASRRMLRGEHAATPIVWPAPQPNASASSDSIAELATRVVDGDVFRVDRKPAAVPYRIAGDSAPSTPPPPPPVPKPVLTLVGIIGGPPWAALIDGVPAHSGTVLVHPRDTVGGLRVRDVSSEQVTLTGLDTVWHLTTKHDSL
jgi:hypothetical protein